MKVYRIGSARFSGDLSGEGAKLFGGRWNHKSIPCIYTSESRAIALLEYTVNINIYEIPRALNISVFEIPDSAIEVIREQELPGDWKQSPVPSSTQDFGSYFLQHSYYPILKIPSSVITEEYNYLLNPLHAGHKHFKILEVKDFVYDVRIKIK
ncbi:MAG: RES family NAD+ phosphorylase [Ginsengibacter sp.]